MKSGLFASVAMTVALLTTTSHAATPKPMSVDKSATFLIDSAASEKVWRENTPARVKKLYPPNKFRFVSEVGGGFTETKTCVVTAHVMLLPVVLLPVQGRKAVYAPIKSATAFDAQQNLSRDQCQELARAKLKDAIQSIASSLAES